MNTNKNHKYLAGISLILGIIAVVVIIFVFPTNTNVIIEFTKNHPFLAPLILILIKIVSIVIPPISAGIISYALIPVFGWFYAFLYSSIGVLIGASIAFQLARIFREPLVKRFVPLQHLEKWQSKLSDKTEFFAFLVIRITTGPIVDFISYIAGLSNITFKKFFLATLLSLLPDMIVYYAGEKIYKIFLQNTTVIAVIILLVLVIIYFVEKKHKLFRKILTKLNIFD